MGCVETDKASILSNAVHQLTQLNAAGGPDGGGGGGGGFVPPDQELQRLREVPPVFEGTGSSCPQPLGFCVRLTPLPLACPQLCSSAWRRWT